MEEERHERPDVDENGVDPTLIREMLKLTPGERLQLLVETSRNLAEMLEKKRIL